MNEKVKKPGSNALLGCVNNILINRPSGLMVQLRTSRIINLSMSKMPSGMMAKLLSLLLLMVILVGCASIETANKPVVTKLNISDRMILPFTIAKCLLEERTGTLYIMEEGNSNIRFYRDGKQIY